MTSGGFACGCLRGFSQPRNPPCQRPLCSSPSFERSGATDFTYLYATGGGNTTDLLATQVSTTTAGMFFGVGTNGSGGDAIQLRSVSTSNWFEFDAEL